jgi:hypothetical protein
LDINNAKDAFAWGFTDEAVRLVDQAADFGLRRFGSGHQLTKTAVRLLVELRIQHAA